jgi:hypothetical protein
MALGSTQLLTEMSTRNLPGGKGRPARKANNLSVIYEYESIVYKNVGAWASHNPMGLHGACYRDSFTFYLVGKLDVICFMLLLLEHIMEVLSLSLFVYAAKGTLREYEINMKCLKTARGR